MSAGPPPTIHATCVAIGGRGVLLEGPSGAGKSDLALRLIDRGATLVSDDRTMLAADGARLLASAPLAIAGRMEVRGLGIVAMPHLAAVPLALWILLGREGDRLPPDPLPRRAHGGCHVPLLPLDPWPAAAAIKVERALALFGLPA